MPRFYLIVGGAIDTTPEKAEEIAHTLATILICDGATHTQARIKPIEDKQGAGA